MSEPKTCVTCKWWVPKEKQSRNAETLAPEDGECRKFAPRGGGAVFLSGEMPMKHISAVLFPFPPCCALDWCGEHTPKGSDDDKQ